MVFIHGYQKLWFLIKPQSWCPSSMEESAPEGTLQCTISVVVSSALLRWQIQPMAPIGMKDVDKIYPNSAAGG
jgi:hypothetical protein